MIFISQRVYFPLYFFKGIDTLKDLVERYRLCSGVFHLRKQTFNIPTRIPPHLSFSLFLSKSSLVILRRYRLGVIQVSTRYSINLQDKNIGGSPEV